MAKQPEIETLLVGYNEKHKINKNFRAITAKFVEMLARDTTTETPNYMETDLDVADANITNVGLLQLQALQLVDVNLSTTLSDYYVYRLAQLNCDTPGAMLTHDALGEPTCLLPGSNGQVLKVSDGLPVWGEDTDTDTVGVTVQEDGVTVATNVTNINFLWTSVAFPTLVTTPAGNQVDIALDDVYASTISALWEDTRSTSDLNINPSGPSTSAWNGGAGEVVRLDLVTDVGITIPTSDNEYYVIMEASSKLISNAGGLHPATGTWTQGVRFYDNTGTSTPLTGNQVADPVGEVSGITDTTAGGSLHTVYCGIPSGTRYVDFDKGDVFLFPLNIDTATIDNRYRAIVTAAAKNADFRSPNNIAYPGGVNTSVTP